MKTEETHQLTDARFDSDLFRASLLPFVYYRSYRKAGISATIVAAYTSALRTVLKEIPRDLRGRTILSPSPELNLPVTVRLRLVARLRTRSGALKRERVCLSRCFNATVATYISVDPVSRKSNCIRPRLYRLFTILFLPRPARRTRRIAGKSGAADRRLPLFLSPFLFHAPPPFPSAAAAAFCLLPFRVCTVATRMVNANAIGGLGIKPA